MFSQRGSPVQCLCMSLTCLYCVSLLLQVIALVMDVFTDVDLLCDLMEASNKRKVPVYILLDEKNLEHFTEMCSTLDIQSSHMSVSMGVHLRGGGDSDRDGVKPRGQRIRNQKGGYCHSRYLTWDWPW